MEWHEGDVIRKLRTISSLTLADLQETSGVHGQVINRIELGITRDAKLETLNRIARAFGLSGRQIRDLVPPAKAVVIRLKRTRRTPVPATTEARRRHAV